MKFSGNVKRNRLFYFGVDPNHPLDPGIFLKDIFIISLISIIEILGLFGVCALRVILCNRIKDFRQVT